MLRALLPMRPSLAIAVLISTLALEARADDTHYHDYPIGGRAVGLGGAFVALADDPSGLYYNPAGIVDSPHNSLQVSTNLYGIEIAVSRDILGSFADTLTDIDRVFAELQIIPTTAGFVQGIGERESDGRYRHTIGLGAFVPSYRSVTVQTTGTADSGDRVAYRRDLVDRTIQACAAYAFRLDSIWRFGLTGALTYRTLRDQEATSIDSAPNGAPARFNTGETLLDATAVALVLTAGAKAQLDEAWSLGLAINTPTVQVFDTARLRVTRSSAGTEGPGFELLEPADLRSEIRNPPSLRFGFAHRTAGGIFTGDAVLHGPVKYRLLVLPDGSENVASRLTIATEIERRPVLNLNAGFETMVTQDLSVAFGFWTNFSSAPEIEGPVGATFEADRLPDIDAYGGSMVLGFHGEHTLTRAGFTVTYGAGDDVISRSQELRPFGDQRELRKIELSQLLFFFFLSSTFMY